jgi:2-succinyl-6-hydroxy-2,4-cyclohexadiene-1-carboxylate synthase
MTRISVNGIHLNVEEHGEGPPLLLLHGFTGSAETWRPFFEAWHGFRLVALDLHGHGESDAPADPARYGVAQCLEDIVAVLDAMEVERTALLGYSMGGRIALHFALEHPNRLSAAVLESASPGIEDEAERAKRVEADEELARNLERDGLEAFIDYWQSIPLWASQASLPNELREELHQQRLRNSVIGLANSLRGIGAGTMPPVYHRLSEIKVPTMLIAGALDERYAELARQMRLRIADSTLWIIQDAGHAAHFEQPQVFGALVADFLDAKIGHAASSLPA